MDYLKKKKMVQIACNVLNLPGLSMKDCEYRFYRGSEWLTVFYDTKYEFCSMCGGKYLSLEKYHLNDFDEYELYSRQILNGFNKCMVALMS